MLEAKLQKPFMNGHSNEGENMSLKNLSIALFYEHPEAGTWSLLDLCQHKGIIAPDDLEPGAFLNAYGAIRMYCDRFMCFLQTGAAGDLRSYSNFLLESLVSSSGQDVATMFQGLSVGTPFLDYENVVAGLVQENQTILVLQDSGSSYDLSYLDPNRSAPEHRLSPYFVNLRIDKKAWKVAAVEALDEYFLVAEERLRFGKNATLLNLVSSWRSCRDFFVASTA